MSAGFVVACLLLILTCAVGMVVQWRRRRIDRLMRIGMRSAYQRGWIAHSTHNLNPRAEYPARSEL